MKILITGATGQVGWELARSLMPLGDIVAPARQDCDLSRPEALPQIIRDIRPDIIVNAAAYTAVDRAEAEEALATTVNGTAVGILANEARRLGALLLHYSTDYVFDGAKPAPYVENDSVCPLSAYGRSKLKGEQATRDAGCDHLILRTTWVYAARGQNFVKTILRLARERPNLRIVDDQHGAPTWARNIADATAHILRQVEAERRAHTFVSGTFHLTASGATTWYGFARAILEQARAIHPSVELLAREISPIPSEAYPLPAKRPKNSRLDGAALKARFGIALPQWDAALRMCLEETL